MKNCIHGHFNFLPDLELLHLQMPIVHYGVKRTETHFDLCLNFILGKKVDNKKSRGKYFK